MHGRTGLSDCTSPYLSGTTLTAKGENPCSNDSFPLKETVWYGVIGGDYEKAITTIRNRINYNIGGGCYTQEIGLDAIISPAAYVLNRLISKGCFSLNEVACIVNSYTNHASKKEYAAFNPANKDEAKRIFDIVHKDTKKAKDRIELVLRHLYYGVADGSITAWQLLDPIGYEAQKGSMNIPENIQSGERDTENLFGDIGTYAKYGAYALGAGVVIYGAVQLLGLFKTIKGAA